MGVPRIAELRLVGEHAHYQGEEHKTDEMKAQIDALRFPWIGR